MESSEHNWANISKHNLPWNANFWQVGLLGVVLSKYPERYHNFANLILYDSKFHQDHCNLLDKSNA